MEKLLQYIWRFKLHGNSFLRTTTGEEIGILDVGQYNTNAGADFLNAEFVVNGVKRRGDVEVHLTSSDWYSHKHHENPMYDSVFLHIVSKCNREVFNSQGKRIRQVEIPLTEKIVQEAEFFLNQNNPHPCREYISQIPPVFLTNIKGQLLVERLEKRSEEVKSLLAEYNGKWEEVLYIRMMRAMGTGINGEPFEQLAKNLPLSTLLRHSDNLFQMEALLLGQAGLLSESTENPYEDALRTEYNFLKHKYQLTPLKRSLWRMLRLRPTNFPHLRIAQMATLYFSNPVSMLSRFAELPSHEDLTKMLSCMPSKYWQEHYSFSNDTHKHSGRIGGSTINILTINAIVPVVFCYGRTMCKEELCEHALNWLEEIASEDNRFTREWLGMGIECLHAGDSQAVIRLEKEYCEKKRCFFCSIGHKILSQTFLEK